MKIDKFKDIDFMVEQFNKVHIFDNEWVKDTKVFERLFGGKCEIIYNTLMQWYVIHVVNDDVYHFSYTIYASSLRQRKPKALFKEIITLYYVELWARYNDYKSAQEFHMTERKQRR